MRLVDAGADPTLPTKWGRTPAAVAAYNGHKDLESALRSTEAAWVARRAADAVAAAAAAESESGDAAKRGSDDAARAAEAQAARVEAERRARVADLWSAVGPEVTSAVEAAVVPLLDEVGRLRAALEAAVSALSAVQGQVADQAQRLDTVESKLVSLAREWGRE